MSYVKWDEFIEEELELKFWGTVHNGARRMSGCLA